MRRAETAAPPSAPGPALALALLLALCACGEGAATVEVGRPAPPFAAPDLAGDTVSLADLRGRPVFLNVWATWCVPCRQEMPDLQTLSERYAGDGLRVVGVSIDQAGARGAVRAFLDDLGVGFTILHDPGARVTRAFRTVGVPESFLLDGDGVLRARWSGPLPLGAAEAAVKEVLGRSP